MTLKEAYKILGASPKDAPGTVKTKYKKLLILYHPDSDPTGNRDSEDDEKIRQVIEAYRKIRESEDGPGFEPYEFTWDAFENKRAFSERNVYVQFKMYDEELPLSRMARGRFVWDPDMEEFRLFSKSVLEACREAITDCAAATSPHLVKDLFHLMMQEYVLPADSARKLGRKVAEADGVEIYAFTGFVKDTSATPGDPLNIYLREDRAVVEEIVTGKVLGTVSFDADELYYVILPLLEDPEVEARATVIKSESTRRAGSRIHVSIRLAIPIKLKDTPVSYTDRIKSILK